MLIKLVFLAVVQGITEFLPISSSGHLQFLSFFFSFNQENLLLYFLILHAGTAVAALYFFRKDIEFILIGLSDVCLRKKTEIADTAVKWVLLIVCVSFPTMISGLLIKYYFDIESNLLSIGISWIFTSLVLLCTKAVSTNTLGLKEFTYKKAFLVGIAQSLALLPGISRSGSTIAAALFLGATPVFAGKLSFLSSFVAIFGALLLELLEYIRLGNFEFSIVQLLIGFVTSAMVGFLSLKYLMYILKQGKLFVFSLYCALLGVISLCIYFFNYVGR